MMLNRVTTFEGPAFGQSFPSSFLAACSADQVATRERKPSTSLRSSLAAASTVCEAFRTLSSEWRVCAAAPDTSPRTATTTFAPLEALATFCEISLVAALCSFDDEIVKGFAAGKRLSMRCPRPTPQRIRCLAMFLHPEESEINISRRPKPIVF
jgi:hypothetical protein